MDMFSVRNEWSSLGDQENPVTIEDHEYFSSGKQVEDLESVINDVIVNGDPPYVSVVLAKDDYHGGALASPVTEVLNNYNDYSTDVVVTLQYHASVGKVRDALKAYQEEHSREKIEADRQEALDALKKVEAQKIELLARISNADKMLKTS